MKTCFVVMGFGKKKDYKNNTEIDLDVIYNQVIKKEFEDNFSEYTVIRADEISGSDIIDVEMYRLLLGADLVIADITTSNENALYELGIRHGVRPYSTIIMKQKHENDVVPFDLNHNRILMYKPYGISLDEVEASKIREDLNSFIKESEKHRPDSPLYTFIPNLNKPKMDNNEVSEVDIKNALKKENTIASLMNKAIELKNQNNFKEATKYWKKLNEQIPQNEYVIQQLALATYKSSKPYAFKDLMDAKNIIEQLAPLNSLDSETTGIAGAINKQLYLKTNETDFLNIATSLYKRGFILKSDYYNGENFATCLVLKSRIFNQVEERHFYEKCAAKVFEQVITIIDNLEEKDKWSNATLAVANYYLKNDVDYAKYEKLFLNQASIFEKDTYQNTIKLLGVSVDNSI